MYPIMTLQELFLAFNFLNVEYLALELFPQHSSGTSKSSTKRASSETVFLSALNKFTADYCICPDYGIAGVLGSIKGVVCWKLRERFAQQLRFFSFPQRSPLEWDYLS